ncbi:hypothetical protein Ahy_B05g079440 [Arachis hypogaea]|uniref:SWIM-type domain-containing protein n=1 Tax=Arachis hypogaea TaxID=3818 RepID=A0A444Z9U8_ARAHY|nr:hypothetical protein Ahy_B05g079440 [Arachis hypogaea]
MESDSEDSSEFSGQWTDRWSTGSEAVKCETLGTESEQPEEVNMTLWILRKIWLFVEFDSVEEAHARYVEHARVTGFVVRKGDSRKDNEGNVVRKFFFCNREGLRDKKHYERIDRQRAHKPITRTNCNARFVVHLDKGCGKWKMKSFVADYNHELAPADRTNIMAPHRHMSEGDKAHVHSLHEAGFQRTQIMGFFAYLTGGYRNLHFITKERSENCLLELVENLDHVVKDYRNNEFMIDFKYLYSEPGMTTGLESIEKAVSKVYTREIFFEVKKQIESVAALIVLHSESYGTIQKFMLRKFRRPRRVYTVLYDSSSEIYECSHKLWNSLGVPCSHIFCVMKELEIEVMSTRLVLHRWCKDAKSLVLVGAVPVADLEKAFRVRYGSLWSACMSMCFLAAQDGDTYENVLSELEKLTKEIEATGPRGGRNRFGRAGDVHVDILDPTIVKSKGAPRGSTNARMGRQCRRCHGLEHDRRNCTTRNEGLDDEVSV